MTKMCRQRRKLSVPRSLGPELQQLQNQMKMVALVVEGEVM